MWLGHAIKHAEIHEGKIQRPLGIREFVLWEKGHVWENASSPAPRLHPGEPDPAAGEADPAAGELQQPCPATVTGF